MHSTDDEYEKLQSSLLNWFHIHKRELPFRIKPTAYKIWVSEVMLQQTRVNAMLPLYDQFLLRFPDMETLAVASEEEVLEYWSGLGYYSRARNLRKACSYVVSRYNGRFPEKLEEALKIPGVGPYTARAVLSMAYGKKYAVLEGNVKRIISRLFAESNEKNWQILADRILNQKDPGDHNQSMMELGALVCLPNPKCGECPIATWCKSFQEDKVSLYPPVNKDKEKIGIELHFYLIEKSGKFLLLKDKNRRFFKDIFSLPYTISPVNPKVILDKSYHNPQYLLDWIQELGVESIPGTTKHNITHHNIDIFLHKTIKELDTDHHLIHGAEEIWISWENIKNHFPSSIAKKIDKFPGVGGLFSL